MQSGRISHCLVLDPGGQTRRTSRLWEHRPWPFQDLLLLCPSHNIFISFIHFCFLLYIPLLLCPFTQPLLMPYFFSHLLCPGKTDFKRPLFLYSVLYPSSSHFVFPPSDSQCSFVLFFLSFNYSILLCSSFWIITCHVLSSCLFHKTKTKTDCGVRSRRESA